jgi:hypothetical protein
VNSVAYHIILAPVGIALPGRAVVNGTEGVSTRDGIPRYAGAPEPPASRTKVGNHTFRATGITTYLKGGGSLESAAAMGHGPLQKFLPVRRMRTRLDGRVVGNM